MEHHLKTAKLEYESNNFDAEAFKKRLFIRLNKESLGVGYKAQRSTKNFLLGKKQWVVAAVAVIFLGIIFKPTRNCSYQSNILGESCRY